MMIKNQETNDSNDNSNIESNFLVQEQLFNNLQELSIKEGINLFFEKIVNIKSLNIDNEIFLIQTNSLLKILTNYLSKKKVGISDIEYLVSKYLDNDYIFNNNTASLIIELLAQYEYPEDLCQNVLNKFNNSFNKNNIPLLIKILINTRIGENEMQIYLKKFIKKILIKSTDLNALHVKLLMKFKDEKIPSFCFKFIIPSFASYGAQEILNIGTILGYNFTAIDYKFLYELYISQDNYDNTIAQQIKQYSQQ